MAGQGLPNSWLSQVEPDPEPIKSAGDLHLTDRAEYPEFWRFTLTWPGATGQLYNFVEAGEVAHKAPCVTVGAFLVDRDNLSPRLEGWADPDTSVFLTMASGHALYHSVLYMRFDNIEDFNLFEAEPDVAGALRRFNKACEDGTLLDQWVAFAKKHNREWIVFDTPNPRMHARVAKKIGFVPETTANGRTYWRYKV